MRDTSRPGTPHAVRTARGTDYHYDAKGQLDSSTGEQTRTNVWTAFNQPQSLSHRGSSTQFTYDEGYKRVSEVINGGATVRNLVIRHSDFGIRHLDSPLTASPTIPPIRPISGFTSPFPSG